MEGMGEPYIAELNESIEDLLKKTAKLYLFRARKYKETGRFKELLDDIERGVAFCGEDLGMRKDFLHLQAEFFMEQKDCERAYRALRSVFELYTSKNLPCDAQTLILNDKLKMIKGNYVSAHSCFQVIETSGKDSDHLELGNSKPSESKMDGMEKLIYLHVNKLGDSFTERPKDSHSSYIDATNDWYVLKHGSYGVPELSRAFEDISQLNHPNLALDFTTCQVIGSCIYVIGGCSIFCRAKPYWLADFDPCKIHYLDTRNPKDGWRTCATIPSIIHGCISAVVDGKWLCVLGVMPGPTEVYAVNILNVGDGSDEEKIRKFTLPSDSSDLPTACTGISRGLLVYFETEGTFYQLDCSNGTWTVYHKGLPYRPSQFLGFTTISDDGIFYNYDTENMRFTSYDVCNKKELFVVDLPRTIWFGCVKIVKLVVLAKNKFCIVWSSRGESLNLRYIYYVRFSVCYEQVKPTVVEEETKKFLIGAFSLLDVVALDPHSDIIS